MINLRSILGDKAIIAILSLAAMVPMVTGKIDLTVGFGIVLWHILAISPADPIRLSLAARDPVVLALGALDRLPQRPARRDRADRRVHRDSRHGHHPLRDRAVALAGTPGDRRRATRLLSPSTASSFLDLPITGYYVLSLTIVLWVVLEYLPIGRHFYAIGANRKAAALNGIPVRALHDRRFRFIRDDHRASPEFVLAARLRIGQANVGLDYLLPALVGAFLGSTTIKPGRVNVWGTIFGVLILAIGISGIQQFGGAFFVEPLFNGTTLVISIGLAGFAQRRAAPSCDRRVP